MRACCRYLPFWALLALPGCGSRTELLTAAAVCRNAGETRACSDACGIGSETCVDGAWSECVVPEATRSCEDACGVGTDSCVDGAWQGCVVPEASRPCQSVCGAGVELCRGGSWRTCNAPQPRPPKIAATVRDFSPTTHPDFEASYMSGVDLGIVRSELGPDDKPVYTARMRTKSTSGEATFRQWFNDDPSVNLSAPLELQLALAPGQSEVLFQYDNRAFFPIDGRLLGNEGRNHNFHFTLEASTTFQYVGGETFSFSGDDDMWVFINRRLTIDLGGLHPSLSAEVSLDAEAERLGLVRGGIYPLHFFFAERHTDKSNFTIRTTIAEPGSCE